MTIADERTRAMLCAGGFLIELARDKELPLAVRQRAAQIARHFPTIEDVGSMAASLHPVVGGSQLRSPDPDDDPIEYGRHGPLRYSTRVAWPT